MFSKNKGNSGTSPAPHAIDLSKEFIEMEEGAPSVLSSALIIRGNVQKQGDIHIEGKLYGNMHARAITIGSTAQIKGNITAEHVRCSGKIEGNILARVVELFASARVAGDILHETLAIEGGAKLDGVCRRSSDLAKQIGKDGLPPLADEQDADKKSLRSAVGFGGQNNKDKAMIGLKG